MLLLSTDYFSKHLGVYRPVLAALEALNRAVLSAMDTTKLVSGRAVREDPVKQSCGERGQGSNANSSILWLCPFNLSGPQFPHLCKGKDNHIFGLTMTNKMRSHPSIV